MALLADDARQDIVTRLTAAGLAGGRVYDSRTTPYDQAEMYPAIVVSTSSHRLDPLGSGPPSYRVTSRIEVRCLLEGTVDATLGNARDELAWSVIDTLMTDAEFVTTYEPTGPIDMSTAEGTQSDKRRAEAVVTFELRWVVFFEPTSAESTGDDLDEVRMTVEPEDGGELEDRYTGLSA